MSKYTIKSTDKVALKEYDQKSALFQTMNENKTFNINPANHALYHALMEALIVDEDAMDKGVADTVKNHKRQHDDDEDDDEDTSAGPNQGKKTKRRRTKESESSMKPSTTKETSRGKALSKSSKTDVVDDVDRPQYYIAPKTNKPSRDTWFKQPPRPPTPDPEWNKRQVIDNLTQELLVGPVYNMLKGTCTSSIELEYNMEEWFKALIDKLDWNNPEGDRRPFELTKPLPLKGRPGHLTVTAEYFNNDLEILKSSDPEKKYTTSITKTKTTRYEIVGIKDMVPMLWSTTKVSVKSVSVKKLHGYGHLEEIVVRRVDRELYKLKKGDFVDLHLNDIEDVLLFLIQHKLFQLDGSDIVDLIVALRMFTRSLITKLRVEDLQLGVELPKET
ncbi:hypothetical protein Tco_1570758 [Tanacetum coccineum]